MLRVGTGRHRPVHSMLLFIDRSTGRSDTPFLRRMRQVIPKHLSCQHEAITWTSEIPHTPTQKPKRLDIENLVHPIIDECLVKERGRPIASNNQIRLLQCVLPTRILVEGLFQAKQDAMDIRARNVILHENRSTALHE